MKPVYRIIVLTCSFVGLFYGCNSEPFPIGERQDAGFQVPLVPTYTFNFKTGSGEITGEQSNLKIVSGADIKNLITATPGTSEQRADRGVISGVVVDGLGRALSSVSIGSLDKAGRIVRDVDGAVTAGVTNADGELVATLLYNSINGVPEFVNTSGTSTSGSFTALNVPPGEHYIKAVQGGRGNARVNIFAGSLSLIDMEVFPVTLPTVAVTGVVRGRNGLDPVGQTEIRFPGLGGFLTTGSTSAFSLAGLNSESIFLVKTSAAGHVDTYQEMFTDLGTLTLTSVTPEITKNLTTVSSQDLQEMVAAAGASLIPGRGILLGKVVELSGKKDSTIVSATDSAGNAIGEVYYFPAGSDLPTCNDGNIGTCLTKTSTQGQFLMLNLPPGDVFIKAYAEVESSQVPGEMIKSTGALTTSVFADAITLKDLALQVTLREDPAGPMPPPTWYTLKMSGTVRQEDRITAVTGVDIQRLGHAGTLATSDAATGAYEIPAGTTPAPTDISPLLTNSLSLFRLEKAGFTTTYQNIATGGQDRFMDLSIVSNNLVNPAAGTGAVWGRLINRRLGGSINEVQVLATQVIDANGQVVTTGEPVGIITYFDENGDEDLTATATANNGLFLIKNLPPGLVVIKADSSDDSGNQMVRVFADGVTLLNMPVNHVPLTVPVQGTLTDLHDEPVTGATLSLLGEGTVFTSESFSMSPGVLVPANGTFVTRVEKSNFVDTFNDQLKTDLNPQTGVHFYVTTLTELTGLANQGGLTLDIQKGIVSGKVLEKLFAAAPAPVSTGTAPAGIVSGFFNEDIFLDVAVTHSPDQVRIFLGKTGGGFDPGASVTVGSDPAAIGLGDFNRDGHTDLVVGNRGEDSLSLLFGTGDGQFVVPLNTQITAGDGIGTAPVFIKVADLNRDGRLDLAVANEGSDNLTVLMGDGSGGFTNADSPCPTPCNVEENPLFITAADFDTDGGLDLAVAGTGSDTVRLLLSGEGVPNPFVLAGAAPRAVETGDLNSDGHADLVVVNSGADSFSTFLGDGNGVFVKVDCSPGPVPADDLIKEDCALAGGSMPSAVLLADFDEDGRLDLVVANEGTATVSLLPGIGNGYFDPPTRIFNVGTRPTHLISGDFNQDGRDDIIALNSGSDNFTVILSDVRPVKDVRIEVLDDIGQAVGAVRYMNDDLDVDPALTRSGNSGRFIIFDLPFGLNVIKGIRQASAGPPAVSPLIGNTLVNITALETVTHTELRLEVGEPATVTSSGVTCRVVGEVCTKIGRSEISMLGTATENICPPGPDCLSGENANYTLTLDPHSTYVARILGPEALLPGDTDGDGIPDQTDNCPNIPNQEQVDENSNGVGDKCENFIDDKDDDGIDDLLDNCPDTPNPGQANDDQDFLGNACDPTPNGKPTASSAEAP